MISPNRQQGSFRNSLCNPCRPSESYVNVGFVLGIVTTGEVGRGL